MLEAILASHVCDKFSKAILVSNGFVSVCKGSSKVLYMM